MIDLHCHILPGIDDGATDLDMALEMARCFEEQGVSCIACTPHILPGVYHNSGPAIRTAVDALQFYIDDAGIDLRLAIGADNHMVPNFAGQLRSGHLLALADSRYVLVEPPHHVVPPRLANFFFDLLVAGYVPILTHPERLSWIEDQYDLIGQMAQQGVWMQITSGSLLGRFGRRPKRWAERMLSDGYAHILASDAHGSERRPPDLADGAAAAERLVGRDEAHNLVVTRPHGVIVNSVPSVLPAVAGGGRPRAAAGGNDGEKTSSFGPRGAFLKRVWGRIAN